MLQQGQQFPLTIKRLGINGEGVGYFKKQVVFVPGALPGEEVVVQAMNVYPTYTEGKWCAYENDLLIVLSRLVLYMNGAVDVNCNILL
ncbi:23S rRNA (uracil(1939)-C(5))-methyltransferase RlmD [Anoxybacillus sp. BCO1]|nr:23S rRNA (uracil(1939)-C(5))-methyltransferase RlmD [Anoxybacillus sp. BCO1]